MARMPGPEFCPRLLAAMARSSPLRHLSCRFQSRDDPQHGFEPRAYFALRGGDGHPQVQPRWCGSVARFDGKSVSGLDLQRALVGKGLALVNRDKSAAD